MKRRRSSTHPASRLPRSAHVALTLLFLVHQSAWAATITVDSVGEGNSSTPPNGTCTLREAIIAANTNTAVDSCPAGEALPVVDTVVVPDGTYTRTLTGSGEDAAETGDLDLTEDVVIQGASSTVIDAASDDRVFHVLTGVNAQLNALTILNGNGGFVGSGGGILNQGDLTISDCLIRSNATGGSGGGIANEGSLGISDSEITDNNVTANDVLGVGIYSEGFLILVNSTVARNHGLAALYGGGGGGIASLGVLGLTNSTLSDNSIIGGYDGQHLYLDGLSTLTNVTIGSSSDAVFVTPSSSTTFTNTIVDGGCDVQGVVTSNGGNVQSLSNNCGFSDPTDQVNVSAGQLNLGSLADNGGSTETRKLLAGSVAIDAAGACGVATDQRGGARPQGSDCDSGAFEFFPGSVVTVGPGGPSPECLLPDAFRAADLDLSTGDCLADSGAIDTVQLTGDVTLTAVDKVVSGPNGVYWVREPLTLEGAGHTIARDSAPGTPEFRIFYVALSGSLTLNDVTVSNGRSTTWNGGALLNLGTTDITNSTLSGNTAYRGGAVSNEGGLTLTNSTLAGNSAPYGYGGGLHNDGTATLTSSTISGNYAYSGGGLMNESGTPLLVNMTLSGNSAALGGGVYAAQGSVSLLNSTLSGNAASYSGGGGGLFIGSYTGGSISTLNVIVANSPSGGDCASLGLLPTDFGNSFTEDASCGAGFAAITPGTDFDTTLAPNGGPTETHALLSGSVAIDAAGDCTTIPVAGLATDQRGAPRPAGSCDSGSFEAQTPVCGSGFVDFGEECDDGNTDPNDGCGPTCLLEICGDGILHPGEQCDDGNTADGDCCSSTCQFQPALGVGGTPNCCSAGVCQAGIGCGAICFTPGAICKQDGGPGTACTCEIP